MLAIVNISVIAILLIISSIMVYFSSSARREFFGYTALLYHAANDAAPSFYIVNRVATIPNIGDEVILSVTNKEGEVAYIIDKIAGNANNILTFSQSDIMINLDSPNFFYKCSTIVYKNAVIGRMIYAVTNDVSPVLVCVIIIGGAIIISLAWILSIMTKRGRAGYFTSSNPLEVFIGDKKSDADMLQMTPSEQLQFSYLQEEVELLIDGKSLEKESEQHTLNLDVNAILDEVIAKANKDFAENYRDK